MGNQPSYPIKYIDSNGNELVPFDFANQALRVNVVAGSGGGGASSSFAAAFPATGTAVGFFDGANMVPGLVDGAGFLKVNVAAGGTAGQQYADGTARGTATGTLAMGDDGVNIQSLKVDVGGVLAIQDNGGSITVDGTVAITAAALPLPAGAATEAGHLATIDTSTARIPALGQALAAASVPVVLTAVQQAALTPPAAITGFALEGGHLANIDTSTARIPSLGQALAAASVPVVLTAAQLITLTPLATVTANIGTSGALALDATLTGGTAKVIARGGAKGSTVAADVTSSSSGANHQVLDVGIYDAAGNLLNPTLIRALTAADIVTANGDVDHDAVNTLKNIQIAGNASPYDVAPTAVSANGDRVRSWMDRYGAQIIRTRKIRESYTAVFRLDGATAGRMDQTFTQVANTDKQWATIYHTISSTKDVRLMRVVCYITAWSAASQGLLELRSLAGIAAPATGNPAIVPTPRRFGGTPAAAECTCLYLPTTQGSTSSVNSVFASLIFDLGIMGAASAANPMSPIEQVLYDATKDDPEVLPPTLGAASGLGFAVILRTVGTPAVRMTIVAIFTEELP